MAFNFKKVAEESTLLSPIMAGRDKLETDAIIDKELTVVGFDFAPKFDEQGRPIIEDDGTVDTFGVVVFREFPDCYYCVGAVFTKICKAWAAEFESAAKASEALAQSGGVKVRFRNSKTKRGNNLTSVEILD